MHRLGAAVARRLEDPLAIQIALAGRSRADGPRFIGKLDMQRAAVGLGINRHCHDPEPPRGADYAAGDLAAIGDQYLCEHSHHRNTEATEQKAPSPLRSLCLWGELISTAFTSGRRRSGSARSER